MEMTVSEKKQSYYGTESVMTIGMKKKKFYNLDRWLTI